MLRTSGSYLLDLMTNSNLYLRNHTLIFLMIVLIGNLLISMTIFSLMTFLSSLLNHHLHWETFHEYLKRNHWLSCFFLILNLFLYMVWMVRLPQQSSNIFLIPRDENGISKLFISHQKTSNHWRTICIYCTELIGWPSINCSSMVNNPMLNLLYAIFIIYLLVAKDRKDFYKIHVVFKLWL